MKKRRDFLRKAVGLAGALGLFSLPALARKKDKIIPGEFVHMVFFWLKDTTDTDEFVTSTEGFIKQVEVVNSYHIGIPAGTPREVVDNSYQVCLVVTFDSKEDQDIYQEDEVHKKYVSDNKDKWTKVQIYDSWNAV